MQVLDWEVCELQRKHGDKLALKKLNELCDLSRYDPKFFLGNLNAKGAYHVVLSAGSSKRESPAISEVRKNGAALVETWRL